MDLDEIELIPRGESNELIVDIHGSPASREKKIITLGPDLSAPDEIVEDVTDSDFVWRAMQKAYDPLTNSVRDLKVDDAMLKQAHNYWHFCTEIAGKAIKPPFARQMWIAMQLMGEYCPICTDPKWLDLENVPVDMDTTDLVKKVTLYNMGRCPKCGTSRAANILANRQYDFNQLVMVAGQRGGKSAFTVTITGYHTHLMLKAPRLSSVCRGIQDFTPLTGTFVALTTGRAIKLLWQPFKALIDNSEWFQSYFKNLDDHGNKYGKEFYKSRDLFVRFFNKNLDYYPMGPMKRTLRGDTRLIACYSGNTLVLTDQGWQRIRHDLTGMKAEIGGELHRIVAWSHQGKKMTYRLTAENGLFVDATEDHKFQVFDPKTQSTKMVELQHLTTKDYLVCGVGYQPTNKASFPLDYQDESEEQKERGHFFQDIYDFLCEAYDLGIEFTNSSLSEATGASDAILMAMNTRLRRLGILKRVGGKHEGKILLGVSRKPLSPKELRKSPDGVHTRKWNQELPESTSVSLGHIIGYLLADGDLAYNGKFDNTSEEKVKHFSNCWKEVFGVELFNIHDARYKGENRKETRTYFASRRTCAFLTANGFPVGRGKGGYAEEKFIPDFVYSGSRAEQLACVSAYLSCDGKIGAKTVSYITESPKMAIGFQILLAGLGYRTYRSKSPDGNMRVEMNNDDTMDFLEEYNGLEKRDWKKDREPEVYFSEVKHVTRWDVPQRDGTRLKIGQLERGHPLHGGHFYLSKVSSVKEKHVEDVYDITVNSREHLLLANGLAAANCTDELGWFPFRAEAVTVDEDTPEEDSQEDEREMANGDEVHQSLDNSLSTVRTEVYALYKKDVSTIPTGLNLNISSPASWKDKICRLLKDSENKAGLSFGVRLPTWEINPLYTRDHPIIMSAYAKNFRRAERDFGANPPRLAENLFRRDMLLQSFKGKQHHAIKYDDSDPDRTVGTLLELVTRARWRPNALGMDAGLTNNSFALALGCRNDAMVEVLSAVELIPQSNKQISYPRLYENVILPLVKECNIVYAGADRWNSVNMLQQIEEDTKGKCRWAHFTLQLHHFKAFGELVNNGLLTLPELTWPVTRVEEVRNYKAELKSRPIEHLLLQFLTVQNRNGTLLKGDGYTDDIFRAVAVLCAMHFTPKVREYILTCGAKDRDGLSQKAVTVVSGRSAPFAGLNINR